MSELPKIAVVVSIASLLAVSPSALHAQSECNARQIRGLLMRRGFLKNPRDCHAAILTGFAPGMAYASGQQ
jgi:hypothetical protein